MDKDEKGYLVSVHLKLYEEHCVQARHHESQRSTVASVLVAVSGGIIGLITVDKNLTPADFVPALFLFVLGLFGCFFTYKQFERSRFHQQRRKRHQIALDRTLQGIDIDGCNIIADEEHKKQFRFWGGLRLWEYWVSLHVLMAALGLVLAAMSLDQRL